MRSLSLLTSLPFLLLVASSVFILNLPIAVLSLYIFASIVTFVIYAKDKRTARNGHWRTQESTLHLLAIVGGWPGAMIAQQMLRHKSSKVSFRAVF